MGTLHDEKYSCVLIRSRKKDNSDKLKDEFTTFSTPPRNRYLSLLKSMRNTSKNTIGKHTNDEDKKRLNGNRLLENHDTKEEKENSNIERKRLMRNKFVNELELEEIVSNTCENKDIINSI